MPANFLDACAEVRLAHEAWASSPDVREAFANDRRKFIALRLAAVWPPIVDVNTSATQIATQPGEAS